MFARERRIMREWLKLKPEATLDKLPRDCLAEILSYLDNAREWIALLKTCKELHNDMYSQETIWGSCNMKFVVSPRILLDRNARLPFDRIYSLAINEKGISTADLFEALKPDLIRLDTLSLEADGAYQSGSWKMSKFSRVKNLNLKVTEYTTSGVLKCCMHAFDLVHSLSMEFMDCFSSTRPGFDVSKIFDQIRDSTAWKNLEKVSIVGPKFGPIVQGHFLGAIWPREKIRAIELDNIGYDEIRASLFVGSSRCIGVQRIDIELLRRSLIGNVTVLQKLEHAIEHVTIVLQRLQDEHAAKAIAMLESIFGSSCGHEKKVEKALFAGYKLRDNGKLKEIRVLGKTEHTKVRFTYNTNGNLVSVGGYYCGDGYVERYDGKSGIKTSDSRYFAEDILDGEHNQYYLSNGSLEWKGEYSNGSKSGTWYHYSPDGHIIETKHFQREPALCDEKC